VITVESRKAWRNRKHFAGEGVMALLEALRRGAGAESVGLFDDDRADPVPGPGPGGALNFWDAFDLPPCAAIDWDQWYLQVRTDERVETTCGCEPPHRLCGFLIHGRWVLLLVMPASLPGDGAAAIASSLRALAAQLPPAQTAQERADAARYDGDPTSSSAVTGAPTWWVRKLPQ
jgi:hypothetical protein